MHRNLSGLALNHESCSSPLHEENHQQPDRHSGHQTQPPRMPFDIIPDRVEVEADNEVSFSAVLYNLGKRQDRLSSEPIFGSLGRQVRRG